MNQIKQLLIALLLCGTTSLSVAGAVEKNAPNQRPNIVLVMADDKC
jgi:hypothetical protein